MDNIINFLNNRQLSAGETILTSVISSLIFLFIVTMFKSIVLNFYHKCKSKIQTKYRRYQGKLTTRELIELERKHKSGLPLSKKEAKILAEHHQKLATLITQNSDIIKNFKMPDFRDLN